MSGYSVLSTMRKLHSERPEADDERDPDAIELTEEAVDFVELLQGVSGHFAREAERKGLSMVLSIETGVPKIIYADPLRLRQIILILLGNSVRFTDKGGIHLAVRAVQDRAGDCGVELTMSDTGAGADASAQHGIFTRLVRAMNGASDCLVDNETGSSLRFTGRFNSPEGSGRLQSSYTLKC